MIADENEDFHQLASFLPKTPAAEESYKLTPLIMMLIDLHSAASETLVCSFGRNFDFI